MAGARARHSQLAKFRARVPRQVRLHHRRAPRWPADPAVPAPLRRLRLLLRLRDLLRRQRPLRRRRPAHRTPGRHPAKSPRHQRVATFEESQSGRPQRVSALSSSALRLTAALCCCTSLKHREYIRIILLKWVELRGLEPLTPCLQTTGSMSTSVHSRRSPSLDVHPGPCRSGPVAVLSCCTHLDPSASGPPPATAQSGHHRKTWMMHRGPVALPRHWSAISRSQPSSSASAT